MITVIFHFIIIYILILKCIVGIHILDTFELNFLQKNKFFFLQLKFIYMKYQIFQCMYLSYFMSRKKNDFVWNIMNLLQINSLQKPSHFIWSLSELYIQQITNAHHKEIFTFSNDIIKTNSFFIKRLAW